MAKTCSSDKHNYERKTGMVRNSLCPQVLVIKCKITYVFYSVRLNIHIYLRTAHYD